MLQEKQKTALVRIPLQSRQKLQSLAALSGKNQTEFLGFCIDYFHKKQSVSISVDISEMLKEISLKLDNIPKDK